MEMIALQMASFLHKILIFFFLVFLLQCSSSFPLCTNSRAPISLKAPLTFCPYNGSSCCNYTEDSELQKQFLSMNISNSDCGSIAKLMLCTKCNPHSSDLSRIERDSCAEVLNASIWNSSFSLAASKESSEESISSSEPSVSVNNRLDSSPPHGICLEKIGNGSFLSMVPHPDGSNRVFLSNQEGRIWLAEVPALESNKALDFDESKAFFDLTDLVYSDVQFGVMGLAFHPNFTDNGRFFVSFNCDKAQMASCSGRCSCNSEADCNPSKLGLDESAQPCRFQSVISEFTVNGTSSKPSEAASAIPSEVRRIFTMGLPYKGNHAGQIIFGPEDGYLYFMMGDGGNKGDPFNFAQNKKSVLGKILRLDVNQIPSSSEINDLDLWGNYSIPKDNPYTDDSELLPEIWALGFRNPWRCSFDSKQPSYFFCTDVGEGSYEEINLISRGGNYGWRLYEGPYLYPSSWTPGDNTSLKSVNPIFPIMGYSHSSLNNKVGSASVAGGYVYRSSTDPCLNGRFVYADLYGEAMWAAAEDTKGSGIYHSTKLPFACAEDSPIACEAVEGSPLLSLVYSFAEDNDNQLYLLASKGVFRVVRPSRCGYPCASEMNTDAVSSPSGIPSSADKSVIFQLNLRLLFFLCSIKFFYDI